MQEKITRDSEREIIERRNVWRRKTSLDRTLNENADF